MSDSDAFVFINDYYILLQCLAIIGGLWPTVLCRLRACKAFWFWIKVNNISGVFLIVLALTMAGGADEY